MATSAPLEDQAERLAALTSHERTLLVEAGAGSGKTAVLAGRIAMMLLQGVRPESIAAVTFTELAASELLHRVRDFVSRLLHQDIPMELRLALPDGLSPAQLAALREAQASIDEITCSTIHGFCQRLIRPYPVEASIDPGAAIMDRDQAELAFHDVVDDWLRQQLGSEASGLLAELMLVDVAGTLGTVKSIIRLMKQHEDLQPPPAGPVPAALAAFKSAVAAYGRTVAGAGFEEAETFAWMEAFRGMAQNLDAFDVSTDSGLVGVLQSKPHASLCTEKGTFRAFQKKTKWEAAATATGRSKAEGGRIAGEAKEAHGQCCDAWDALLASTSGQVAAGLLPLLRPAVERMQEYKRSAALMDFDDLLRSARDMLRNHSGVRDALAQKYQHVLVDEFQDTDPIQSEIFWRLCGSPPMEGDAANWRSFQIRPGALFIVGDPKQAIYRFRGADVGAYIEARNSLRAQDEGSILSISVNFRSCAPILDHVNNCFAQPLAETGQPGFIALQALHAAREGLPSVVALNIAVADENGKASAEQIRDGEADAVAKLCAHLIGTERIKDPGSGELRACRPGDIALLAPTGADLWRYEQALEGRGIPVATQAGKGLFRRQEIQDLIAITRVLADGRDSLALGALLRGPLVGLADEAILDVLWSLRDEAETPPPLSLNLNPEDIQDSLFRDVLRKLRGLRGISRSTTPHNLLSQAVDELRVRPILLQRHSEQAERALANVDLFLSFSRAYEIRGLTAFAAAMRTAWEDVSKGVEGKPDAQEESVSLLSMHAAKGLEWPVVIPINGSTSLMAVSQTVVAQPGNTLYCPVLGVVPEGHEAALAAEKAEIDRERVRLWYVAATRARELMVVPNLDVPGRNAWNSLVDLSAASLPALELPEEVPALVQERPHAVNSQTRAIFEDEAARIAAQKREIVWKIPSRAEDSSRELEEVEVPEVFIASAEGEVDELVGTPVVQGGRERGLVLHKLLEEVLTGETQDDENSLAARARELASMLGTAISEDASRDISPMELATTVRRTLAIEAVAALRPRLLPEFNVYSSHAVDSTEHVRTGIIDAIAYNDDGRPIAVLDWKSDVEPTPEAVNHYKAQVRTYLEMTDTPLGYVVLVTSGVAHEVRLNS